MKFGLMPLAGGEGAILAHAVKVPGLVLKKGDVIRAWDLAMLRDAGIEAFVGARLEAGDVTENVAAEELALRIGGAGTWREAPFTGRCNLRAAAPGLVRVNAAQIDAINAVDEAITLATFMPMQPVDAGEVIATVKVIPFAVPGASLQHALAVASMPAVDVALYLPLRVAVVSTLLPGLKPSVVSKTLRLLEDRLAPAAATIALDLRVEHEEAKLAAALSGLRRGIGDVDLVLIFGASAITDRRDVVPTAIERAGGTVDHLGMPVDPGHLLLLGRIGDGDRQVPLVGAPGSARSAKESGFDFVLRRLLAGQDITGADLRGMGVGGLLSEIAGR